MILPCVALKLSGMRPRIIAAALALAVMCGDGLAQNRIPDDLVRLIEGPKRTEISYKVQVSKPVLTFQQHYILAVGASFSHKQVEHGEVRHLEVLTKLQDGTGHWLDGADYEDYRVPEKLRGHGINYATLIYVRPGKYRVNVALRDKENGKANVYHQDVEIGPLSRDPFPVLDELLPETEFPSRLSGHRGFWELGTGMEPIQVSTGKPTRLDVVLNVTKRFLLARRLKPGMSAWIGLARAPATRWRGRAPKRRGLCRRCRIRRCPAWGIEHLWDWGLCQ